MTISMQTRVAPAESVLFRDLDGEAVLLELESGTYFGLDEVGTRFWHVLTAHEQLGEALRALHEEFDVGIEPLRRDLCEFVKSLLARQLVRIDAA